jgi:hypothetical protein
MLLFTHLAQLPTLPRALPPRIMTFPKEWWKVFRLNAEENSTSYNVTIVKLVIANFWADTMYCNFDA